tara:strand:+ start:195 stop:476 length:282 start_codon:yes stop_codon:yes gene_type:complete
MDAVALGKLRELTGDGSQTFINSSSGTVSGDFYKLQVITDSEFDTIQIFGVSATALAGVSIPAGTILHNVTRLELSGGTVIGYTNPALTGSIE